MNNTATATCIGAKTARTPKPYTTEAESKNEPLTAPTATAAKFLFGEIPIALPRIVPPTAPDPWKGNITNTIIPVTEALSNQGSEVNIAFPFS